MDIFTIILAVVYVGLAILLVIRLPWALTQNIKTGIRFRQNLSKQVAGLRLNKMLSRLGINASGYLHGQRIHEIKHHINQCQSCENTDTCDVQLEGEGDIEIDVATYCPNADDLIAIKNESQINKAELIQLK